jgi:hypothetical protein
LFAVGAARIVCPAVTQFPTRQEAPVNGDTEYTALDGEGAGDGLAGSLHEDAFDDELGLGESEDFSDLETMLEGGLEEGELGEEFAEFEGDPFLGGVWKRVKKVARTIAPVVKKLAPIAGKVVGGAFGGPAGAMIGGKIGGLVSQLEAEEFDGEGGDTEEELEAQTVPGLTAVNEALAEEFAGESAETENEAEAQSLAGGVTIHIISHAPMAVQRMSPILVRRSARLAQLLRRSPRTRPFLKTLPAINRRTVATLAHKAARGKPITPRTAVRTMARQTMRLLGNPQRTATALVKNDLHRRKLRRSAVSRVERV